ncbi:MAG TPA: hypothetical protein VJT31_00140 [Rugosimonospora sp.]|nr:hypothetical protein [Rugosimonospora sp.]
MGAGFLVGAGYATSSLWTGGQDRVVAGLGAQDQVLMEWFLGHAARSLAHLRNPLFSGQLDVPYGVNVMANTSVLGLGLPAAPVTLLFGPAVSFAVLVTLALAGTAAAWYYVLSRHVVSSRAAAAVGGAFCGFAPGMVSESLGHLQMVAQLLIPLIALLIVRMGAPGRIWPRGVALGVLVTWQVFISEETLLFTGAAVGVFLLAYALVRRQAWRDLRRWAQGIGIALAVCVPLLAYPLYRQFLGAGSYRGLPFAPSLIYLDLASYPAFPSNSLAGSAASARLAHTIAEQTSFFGWPLLLVTLGCAVWLWRGGSAVARAAALSGLVFALLSLGERVVVDGWRTPLPGPYRLVDRLPIVDLVVSARLGLVVVPFAGLLLALAVDRAGAGRRRALVLVAVVAAAVPLVPLPLPTTTLAPVPHFVTSGAWRAYVPAGRTLVAVPTASSFALDGIRWSTATGQDLAIPRGYFLGPDRTNPGHSLYGAVPTWTSIVLDEVVASGQVHVRVPGDDRLVMADLRLWRAAVVVLRPGQPGASALRATLDQYLGPARQVDDVWLWDVRALLH